MLSELQLSCYSALHCPETWGNYLSMKHKKKKIVSRGWGRFSSLRRNQHFQSAIRFETVDEEPHGGNDIGNSDLLFLFHHRTAIRIRNSQNCNKLCPIKSGFEWTFCRTKITKIKSLCTHREHSDLLIK